MHSPADPQTHASAKPVRSAGRWAVIGVFGLLTLGFIFRFLQNGYHWVGGHSTAEVNYKVLTIWCLVYVVVCSGLATFAYWLPADDEQDRDPR